MNSIRISASPGARILLGMMAVLSATGCGSGDTIDKLRTHPVSGKLLVNGEPAEDALLYFHRAEKIPLSKVPVATVQKDGSFTVSTYETNDGAPAGDYVVTIQWPMNPESGPLSGNRLPRDFANPASAKVKVTVREEANILAPIELTNVKVEMPKATTARKPPQ